MPQQFIASEVCHATMAATEGVQPIMNTPRFSSYKKLLGSLALAFVAIGKFRKRSLSNAEAKILAFEY